MILYTRCPLSTAGRPPRDQLVKYCDHNNNIFMYAFIGQRGQVASLYECKFNAQRVYFKYLQGLHDRPGLCFV